MNFLQLLNWFSQIKRYRRKIDVIRIANTASTSKVYPNFTYGFILNSIQKHRIMKSTGFPSEILRGNSISESVMVKLNQFAKIATDLETEHKIECLDFYDSAIHILQIVKELRMIDSTLSVVLYFNGKNLKGADSIINYLENYIHTYVEVEFEKRKKRIEREIKESINSLDYEDIKYRLYKLNQKITRQKDAYILNKLTNKSGLSRKDVTQYPELIEAVDSLEELKLIL